MPTPTPLSAKNASVRINTNVLVASKWQVTPEAALLDSSNFEGGGYEDQIAGLRKCSFTVEGWYDGANNMHDAPLTLVDGQTLLNVKLYTNTVGGPFWFFASAIVSGIPITADVHEKILYSFTAKAKGAFVYPTGS